jgi:hypothetical protein
MERPNDVSAWVSAGARCIAIVVVSWSTVLVTGWPAVPVIAGVGAAVGVAAMLVPRRRAIVRRWLHNDFGVPQTCGEGHCLYCCDCPQCAEARRFMIGKRADGSPIVQREPRAGDMP